MLKRRTWFERLFTRPWRPLQARVEVPEPVQVTLPQGHVPPRPLPRPFAHYRASGAPIPSPPTPRTRIVPQRQRNDVDDPVVLGLVSTPFVMTNSAPPASIDPPPDRFESGRGGVFDGGGASARWEEPSPAPAPESAPAPAPEPAPSPAPSDSSSSDSSTSSSSND